MKIYLYFDFDERKEQKGITSPQTIEIYLSWELLILKNKTKHY